MSEKRIEKIGNILLKIHDWKLIQNLKKSSEKNRNYSNFILWIILDFGNWFEICRFESVNVGCNYS